MTNIIVIGAGGHAAEIDEYIRHSQKIKGKKELVIEGFLDDNPESFARYKFSAPFLGMLKEHKVTEGQHYAIGIANLKHRRIFIEKFKAGGAEFISFVHCTAYVSESATIGEGTIIGPNANVGPNVKIGMYNLLNSRCSLGHDTIIGDYNFISPNVCFSGFSKVGDENLFGINSTTIPNITVGNGNKIAAGMVLDQNVGNNSVVFYRFKERVIAVPKMSSD
jgi:sugar O-acyltransferase (sialic acid O-acetyltransferase NeuD family)